MADQGTIYVTSFNGSSATYVPVGTIILDGVNIQQSIVTDPGATNSSGSLTNASIAAGASATLASPTPVTSAKIGTLQHAIFAATQPMLWELQTVNNSSVATTIDSFITDANVTFDWKPGSISEASTVVASTSDVVFQVVCTNLIPSGLTAPAAAYASFHWTEN